MTNTVSKFFGGGGDQTALVKGFAETLTSGSGGGITGLLDKFDAVGLGDKARSWVGDGDKQPVSGTEVRQALGDQEIDQLANKAHMSPDNASEGLATVLPNTVSQLTPGGQIPDTNQLQQMIKSFPGM